MTHQGPLHQLRWHYCFSKAALVLFVEWAAEAGFGCVVLIPWVEVVVAVAVIEAAEFRRERVCGGVEAGAEATKGDEAIGGA